MNLFKSSAIASTLVLLMTGCGGGGGGNETPVASDDIEFDLYGNNVKGSLVFGKDNPPNSESVTYKINSIEANMCEGTATPVPTTLTVSGTEGVSYNFVMQFSESSTGNCITDKLTFNYARVIDNEEFSMTPKIVENPTYNQSNVYTEENGDPLYKYQWHLKNTGQTVGVTVPAIKGEDIDVQRVWEDDNLTGKGIVVAIIDEGVDLFHPDLKDNVDTTLSYNYHTGKNNATPVRYNRESGSGYYDPSHGTAVAGLIGAKGWNGIGTRGVAPNATLVSYNALEVYLNEAQDLYTANKIENQLTDAQLQFYRMADALVRGLTSSAGKKTIDIYNNSWGDSDISLRYDYDQSDRYDVNLRNGVTSGRGGKGSIYVKSAGNGRASCNLDDVVSCDYDNFDQMQTNGYFIVVAASMANGKYSKYSTPGSNILVNAPGGSSTYDYIKTDRQMVVTTDMASKDRGLDSDIVNQTNTRHFDVKGNENYDYTQYMNGTSAAAPIVSGVVALMLEANPNLTWRDVRQILAKSAYRNDANSSSWKQNAAGFWFSNDYGFGRVDAKAAVDMAKTFTSIGGYLDLNNTNSSGLGSKIPSTNGTVSNTATISDNITIENVSVTLTVDQNSTNVQYQTFTYNGNGNARRGPIKLFEGENIFTVSSTEANTSTSVYLVENSQLATDDDRISVVTNLMDINTTKKIVNIPSDKEYYLNVESNSTWRVEVQSPISKAKTRNIQIALTSPSGTRSLLVGAPNALDGNDTYSNTRLSSVQFMDENSSGTWRLDVTDVDGKSFILKDWSISITGR